MARVLENERLLIEVEERGSQLVRIYDKKNDREVLWNADPAFQRGSLECRSRLLAKAFSAVIPDDWCIL